MNLLAKTFQGLEDLLAQELQEIGAWNIKPLKRAVSFDANKEILYKSNLCLRTALRILQPITNFRARNEKELYNQVYNYKWSNLLKQNQTFAIDAVTFSKTFTHSQYVALKTKDAIVDHFKNIDGSRPNVDTISPDLLINVHITNDKVTLSLDSSGYSLHKRGYRQGDHRAPINEVLAAGMVLLSQWDKKQPLIDPMCGSGTILMEAAMIAANIPPNINRKKFGFERWNNFDADLWTKIKDEANSKIVQPSVKISGSDINAKAVDIARQSALDFKLKQFITITQEDFLQKEPEWKKGLIIMNPPYGERLKPHDTINFYKEIGNQLKRNFAGFDAWIISSNFDALKNIGLKPSKKITLFNGSLECKFERFSLYEGSNK
ncbi:MAG: methyltransferase [Marinilabiliaceae bacterium]|nr:methyltransferase [Marinilabiliaceae bacterium]